MKTTRGKQVVCKTQISGRNTANKLCTELLDGHYWAAENTRLEAWLQRGIDGQFEQLHGPIDEATGCERPAPVPRSPAPARIAVQTHRRQVSNRAMHLPEPQHGAQQHLTGTAQISPAPRIVPNRPRQTLGFSDPRVAGPAYHPGHSHQHSSISYPAVPVPHPLELGSVSPDVYTTPRMPRMSISSRSSNSSQGPPTPGCSNFAGTPPRSAKGSISSTSTSSSTLRGTFQLSQLVDEVELLHIAPNPSQTQTFKVVVRNLKPRTTKKEFNDLLEQKIQTYLHYSEMNLVESRGQLYGEITFKDSEVADRVVRKLNGFRFKDRKLQVQRVGS